MNWRDTVRMRKTDENNILRRFKTCTTLEEKKKVVKEFNPLFYILTEKKK